MQPETYDRRILLCVTGLSPQVITETFHALAVARENPFLPTEIHLITTQEGADRARLKVLEPQSGHFWRLCREYDLDPANIRFDDTTIHVIGGDHPLEDIRDEAGNRDAADSITRVVRELTADRSAAIHASIAGGRKTMGFFLGYAMSLLGRPQDSLSHVLVSPPFESHPDFYYPPVHPVVLETRDGKPVRTDRARIELAEIPFIRLRDEMPNHVLGEELSFSETVSLGQSRLERQPLTFDFANRHVHVGDQSFRLSKAVFSFYAWLAKRRKDGLTPLVRQRIDIDEVQTFVDIYNTVSGEDPDDNRVVRAVSNGMDPGDFDGRVSRLHSALQRELGTAARHYFVSRRGRRPLTGYELTIDAGLISFRNDPLA